MFGPDTEPAERRRLISRKEQRLPRRHRKALEQRWRFRRVGGWDFGCCSGCTFDMGLQLRPARKTVFARERMLRVNKRRVGVLLAKLLQQILGLLLQMFEIGIGRQITRHDSSLMPGVRQEGILPKEVASGSDQAKQQVG